MRAFLHMHDVAPNPAEDEDENGVVRELEEENERLRALVHGDAFATKASYFRRLTGFASAEVARRELAASNLTEVLSALHRHRPREQPELVDEVISELKEILPSLCEELVEAGVVVKNKMQKKDGAKDGRGRKPKVDAQHLFLLPFAYVFGGLQQWQFEEVPGFHLSQSQVSLLLLHTLPVVVEKWSSRYYCMRSLAWCRFHCQPATEEEGGVDAVFYLDGSKFIIEKDSGLRGQKATHSKVVNSNIVQVIGVSNSKSWIVESTYCAGGRISESKLVFALDLFERLSNEAEDAGEVCSVLLVVDRGFRDLKEKIEKKQEKGTWPYKSLLVTCRIARHLGTTADDKQVKQHDVEEVVENRAVQATRWVNEKSFAFLKHNRFFQREIRASSLHQVDLIMRLAMATTNMRLGCPPN